MCGIYGFSSSPRAVRRAAPEGFLDTIAQLTSFVPQGPGARGPGALETIDDAAMRHWIALLERTRAASYEWIEEGPFLAALTEPALSEQLRRAAARVALWGQRLECLALEAGLRSQRDREFLNALVVGAKDIAWQLERDVLGNFERLLALLDERDPRALPRSTLAHAYQLRLVLASLDRLEVRGRDSAGIAVYLRFPGKGALESFLDGPGTGDGWRQELEQRSGGGDLTHRALLRPEGTDDTLLAVFKVAREVGKMGENVAFLADAIRRDRLFQSALREPDVEVQCLAHTRWASNGVISLANCHPVDASVSSTGPGARSRRGDGAFLAVLNGDIDNYRDLVERFVTREGYAIDESITTDAKIVPIVVAHFYRRTGGDLAEAFRLALAEFEGSMAIGVMAASHPGELVFGQKGSGQGLFVGVTRSAVALASEMYGVVEFSPRYIKAEGEQRPEGELLRIVSREGGVRVLGVDGAPLPEQRVRRAEITTRDINRGGYPHFFLKEITESVASVRKTLRGKFEREDGGGVRPSLGPDVLPAAVLGDLRERRLRRICLIGQGTAAIAAEAVAHLLRSVLARASAPVVVEAFKATELSAHYLSADMSDCLLVAVSQSGTTTDTNRTVDLARQRGARVVSIVNRRNSDLVYKSDGVLYTSDGRDIEMSVASTKAFYSQVVAGQVLALALGSELGLLRGEDLARELDVLEGLPGAMERVLALAPEIARLAKRFALRRRYWAIVGSGPGKIAANEVRIKLSELCYKAIACDFLEDKKHIDLSSEPLILACLNGIPAPTVSDAVKEIAIFKAHDAIPLVVTDEGEERFDPYAAGVVKVPRSGGALDFLLATMVGHLFGYHAASTFDAVAERLRRLRGALLENAAEHVDFVTTLPPSALTEAVELDALLRDGGIDGALDASAAARLASVFGLLCGRLSLDSFCRGQGDPLEIAVAALSEAVTSLSRPIDAIKHQAKTVTVGISRSEATVHRGELWSVFRRLELPEDRVAESQRRILTSFEPLVETVLGATLYAVEGLDPLGRPCEGSTIRALEKLGCAREIESRCEAPRVLAGTKWSVVKRREAFLGYGQNDGRRILILPVTGEGPSGHVLVYHVALVANGPREVRLRALEAFPARFEALRAKVTEGNLAWDPSIIDAVDNETLFLARVDDVSREIIARHETARV